jgi:flagellar hook-basal body complex protein FliE
MIDALKAGFASGPNAFAKSFAPVNGDGEVNAVASFAAELARTIRAGETAALNGINGEMPLQTVVEKVMESERALTTAVSIRDKVIAAYNEITRMQI